MTSTILCAGCGAPIEATMDFNWWDVCAGAQWVPVHATCVPVCAVRGILRVRRPTGWQAQPDLVASA